MLNQIFSITFNNSFNTEESYVLLKFKKNKNKKNKPTVDGEVKQKSGCPLLS